ncbi:MAG: carbohydrate binding domain-containing protein [Fimbriimonadales bacterium]
MITILASAMVLGLSPTLQEPQLPHHTFAESTGGWAVFGQPSANAKVSLTRDAAHLKVGSGSLQFDYGVAKGEINVLMLNTPDGGLAKMKSIRFWIQSDYTVPVGVVLQEKDGGNYMARFTAPKGKWQRAEIALSDFTLNTGPTDPKDPDGHLDPDQVQSIMIFDLDQMFVQGDPAMATIFGVVSGAHSLYVSDFEAAPDALNSVTASSGNELTIDSLARPQVQWLGIGTTSMSVIPTSSLESAALKVAYHVSPGHPAGVIRAVAPGFMTGATQLSFKAASEKPIKLMVQLEESDGGKYNTVIELPGGSTSKQITVLLSDLKAGDDSKDTNSKLDAELINQLLVVDLTGMADQTTQDNTLQIGKVTATK